MKGRIKYMSKSKWFTCHKNVHYVSQCPSKKKGKEKTWVAALVEIEEFVDKFEN
jgi:hypothetical protein